LYKANSGKKDLSFLANFALEEDLMNGLFQIIPIVDETFCLDLYVAYLNDQLFSPTVKAFLKILSGPERIPHPTKVL
jgi:hypothetical protein